MIVPDFGDDDTDRKIAFICSKANLDMAYPSLILANAALGEGVEVHIFFTFWGMDMIIDERMDDLVFTPVGNTGKMPLGGGMRMPQLATAIPGVQSMSTKMLKEQFEEMGVPPVREFLQQIADSGGHLWACQMSADMNDATEEDLFEEVEGILNAADFINLTEGAQLLFV
jgi:peroxiredoxin family protein